MSIMFFSRCVLLAMLTLVITSCASMSNNGDREQELQIYLLADKNINKDVFDVPSPTRLTFLQLATVVEFDQMNEISTNGDPYKVHLGDSVLDEINVTIRPKEVIDFKLPLRQDTKYLGIISAFRDTGSEWKLSLARQKPKGWQKNVDFLFVDIDDSGIAQITKEDAIYKISSHSLESKGQDINELTEIEKDRLLMATEKRLSKKEKVDVSKGLFSPSSNAIKEAATQKVAEKLSSVGVEQEIAKTIAVEMLPAIKSIDNVNSIKSDSSKDIEESSEDVHISDKRSSDKLKTTESKLQKIDKSNKSNQTTVVVENQDMLLQSEPSMITNNHTEKTLVEEIEVINTEILSDELQNENVDKADIRQDEYEIRADEIEKIEEHLDDNYTLNQTEANKLNNTGLELQKVDKNNKSDKTIDDVAVEDQVELAPSKTSIKANEHTEDKPLKDDVKTISNESNVKISEDEPKNEEADDNVIKKDEDETKENKNINEAIKFFSTEVTRKEKGDLENLKPVMQSDIE